MLQVKVCAVITPAHRASPWIMAYLESVVAQEPCEGWRYEIRIGVDGCEETSRTLLDAGQGHWYSRENVGPFLVRNALMREPADAYALFDADDVMLPKYLRTLLPLVGDGIAGGGRVEVNAVGEPRGGNKTTRQFGGGVCVYSAAAMKRLGAFRPWRIAADFDAYQRAKALKIPIASHRSALYHRRKTPISLTTVKETAIGSKYRRNLKAEGVKLIRQGMTYVEPVCANLSWREPQERAA